MQATTADKDDGRITRAPLPYRGELDGLRGIAVLAVVLSAFGLPLPGGFAGIDVLLVLSGFMIGGALWREYDSTLRIRGGEFILRTIGRHAPAFFVMLFAVTAVGWLILLPDEFIAFAKSAAASVTMLSNVFFWSESQPVFGTGTIAPLLHTWPVALAGQMIVLTALVFLVFARSPGRIVATLSIACGLSLVACIAVTPLSQPAAFYLPPFRLWEFLGGVLLAIWGHKTDRDWQGNPASALLGAVMIGATFAAMPQTRFFPGLSAIIPVTGTLLLIANGAGRNMASRILCHPFVRQIGHLSFALYLWHWPVLLLGRHLSGHTAADGAPWGLLALAIVLAWVTCRFLEVPLLWRPHLHRRVLPGIAAIGGLATLALSAATLSWGGMPGRFDARAHLHMAAAADIPDKTRCVRPSVGPLMGIEVCRFGPEGPPVVLVWGDEQADALRPGLEAASALTGTPGIVIAQPGCPPLFGLRKTELGRDAPDSAICSAAAMQVKQALPRLASIERVLLAGRWSLYASGTGVGLDADRAVAIHDLDEVNNARPQPLIFAREAEETVSLLRHRVGKVFVMRQVPEIPMYDAALAAHEAAHDWLPGSPTPVTRTSVDRDTLALRAALADAPWLGMAETGALQVIDPWPRLCGIRDCLVIRDEAALYIDNNRLNATGARSVADLFVPFLAPSEAETLWMGASQP